MRFEIHIGTDNAAFTENGIPEDELGRILIELGGRLANDTRLTVNEPIRLRDVNGNRVGYAVLKPGDAPMVEAWGSPADPVVDDRCRPAGWGGRCATCGGHHG